MKKVYVITLALVITVSLILSGCSQSAPSQTPSSTTTSVPSTVATKTTATTTAAQSHAPVTLDMWGGPFGGSLYVDLFALMDTMNKTHPWLKGSILETKGGWDNILNSGKDAAKKPYIVGSSDYPGFYESQTGAAANMKDQPLAAKGDRLLLAHIANTAQLVVTFNPNIKSGTDLKGKKVAGWTKGSGAYTTMEYVFKVWGITVADLGRYDGMELNAKVDALKDGLIDAAFMSEPFIPDKPLTMSGNLSELLTSTKPLSYINTPKELYDPIVPTYQAQGRYALPWYSIPAGHYNKSWPAGGAIFTELCAWVYKEMPEDIQYELAKTLIEQSESIAGHGAAAEMMVPSVLVGGIPAQFRDQVAPGALKYYKEKGLIDKYWK